MKQMSGSELILESLLKEGVSPDCHTRHSITNTMTNSKTDWMTTSSLTDSLNVSMTE